METKNQKVNVTFLAHYGVEGQKWGERRYQNKDGSLTEEGRRHWGIGPPRTKGKSFRLETPEERRSRIALKKQRKEEKKEQKNEKKNQKITKKKIDLINKGDREEIYRNRKLFSDEELKYALSRIELTEKFGKNNKNFIERKIEKVRDFTRNPLTSIEQSKKDRLVSKGDASEIFKNRDLFTDDELRSVVSRIDSLNKLKPEDREKANKAMSSAKDGKTKSETIINNLGNAAKIVGGVGGLAIAGWKAYEQVASVTNEAMNTFMDKDVRSGLAEEFENKTSGNSEAKFLDVFLAKTLSGGLPMGVIDPDSKLKAQNAKNYSEKDFRKLLSGYSLSEDDITDIYKRYSD